MLSRAARFHVLIWPEWTPYFFDSSASVISSRIASSATRALNSAEWFFLFVVSDRLSNQSIYLNKWSEIPRPPLFRQPDQNTTAALNVATVPFARNSMHAMISLPTA
jgi:hypothetical protein